MAEGLPLLTKPQGLNGQGAARSTRCSKANLRFPNPNRGHASDTSDARRLGDLDNVAVQSRSAGYHNLNSPCSSGAPGTQVGRYRCRTLVPGGKLLAPAQSSLIVPMIPAAIISLLNVLMIILLFCSTLRGCGQSP
jgi:hypothetical protein